MASASSADPGEEVGDGRHLVDHAGDLTGRQDPDLGLAVDHRRLDEHRRVGGEGDLAPRQVLVAPHRQALADEVAERRAGLLAEAQRGRRGTGEPEQRGLTLDAVDDVGADDPLRRAVDRRRHDGVGGRRRQVALP